MSLAFAAVLGTDGFDGALVADGDFDGAGPFGGFAFGGVGTGAFLAGTAGGAALAWGGAGWLGADVGRLLDPPEVGRFDVSFSAAAGLSCWSDAATDFCGAVACGLAAVMGDLVLGGALTAHWLVLGPDFFA